MPSFIEHEHVIGTPNGTESVRDDGGAAGEQLGERIMDCGLRLAVQRACCLIQNKEAGIIQQAAGDGNSLALAAGQLAASLADLMLQTICN